MWFVYFLQLSSGHIYVGSTNDVDKRFERHQLGHVPSTKPHLPCMLKAYVAVETEHKARELERYFKTGSGKAVAKKRFLE